MVHAGQFELPPDAGSIRRFMGQLPVRKVPGVGKVMERLLAEGLDVHTCGDLLRPDTAVLVREGTVRTDRAVADVC